MRIRVSLRDWACFGKADPEVDRYANCVIGEMTHLHVSHSWGDRWTQKASPCVSCLRNYCLLENGQKLWIAQVGDGNEFRLGQYRCAHVIAEKSGFSKVGAFLPEFSPLFGREAQEY
jgi:hypothetical protein